MLQMFIQERTLESDRKPKYIKNLQPLTITYVLTEIHVHLMIWDQKFTYDHEVTALCVVDDGCGDVDLAP